MSKPRDLSGRLARRSFRFQLAGACRRSAFGDLAADKQRCEEEFADVTSQHGEPHAEVAARK